MILKYQLLLLAINKLLVRGEWIEMPQFSDDSKVYKLSVNDRESFYNKYSNNVKKIVTDYNVGTIDKLINEFGNADRNISGGATEDSVHLSATTTANPSQDYLDSYFTKDEDLSSTNSDDEDSLPIDQEVSTTTAPSSTLELPTEEPSDSSTEQSVRESEATSPDGKETVKGMGLEDYLPMEMLRKVHQTLKAQPTSLKGKIRFLKQFEKDLVAEIEDRLGAALAPTRRRRGAHDYNDHEEEMGFPSLEGALMAISFLTFAVYLIRLVMLLFRNANNTATTGATIFFGRNRRSTNTMNNRTQEILDYIDNFDANWG